MIHFVRSKENRWRIWVSTKLDQTDKERFRDKENNYPHSVPPTTGDRIDIINGSKFQTGTHYYLGFKGCVIIINNGEIKDLIYETMD